MEILEQIKEYANKNHIPIIKDDGCDFLINFCKKNKPINILEIGTAVGYSGAMMLLNSPQSTLTTIEINIENYNIAKKTYKNLNLSNRVNQILGDAKEVIEKLNRKFDLIFLDGPKGQYINYYQNLKTLLNKNGYIIADNIYFHGLVKGPEFVKHKLRSMVVNLRKFIKTIQNDSDVEAKILDKGDGIAVIRKK